MTRLFGFLERQRAHHLFRPRHLNIQRFLYAVIKFQVVNQAVLNSSSLPTSMLFLCIYLALFNRLFQGHNPTLQCEFSQVSAE